MIIRGIEPILEPPFLFHIAKVKSRNPFAAQTVFLQRKTYLCLY